MTLNETLLRKDLRQYAEMALKTGLPCAVGDISEIENADDAGLVDIAASQGWDLARYVSE